MQYPAWPLSCLVIHSTFCEDRLGVDRAGGYGSRPMFPLLRSRKSGPVFRTLLLPCGRIGRYPLRYVSLGVSLV